MFHQKVSGTHFSTEKLDDWTFINSSIVSKREQKVLTVRKTDHHIRIVNFYPKHVERPSPPSLHRNNCIVYISTNKKIKNGDLIIFYLITIKYTKMGHKISIKLIATVHDPNIECI